MHLAVQVEIFQLGTGSHIQLLHCDKTKLVLNACTNFWPMNYLLFGSFQNLPHEHPVRKDSETSVVWTWQMKYTKLVQSVPTLFDVFATTHFGRLLQAPPRTKKRPGADQLDANRSKTSNKQLQTRPHNVPHFNWHSKKVSLEPGL